jgi:hypothetical protein
MSRAAPCLGCTVESAEGQNAGRADVRRNEKAITSREVLDRLLECAHVGRLGTLSDGAPYVVPLQYVYQAPSIYFHSANEGKKLHAFAECPRVCFEIDFYDGVLAGENACSFSTRYAGVIVFGTATVVQDIGEKRRALDGIMCKYAGRGEWSLPWEAVEATTVVRISCDEITGKRSGDYHP